PPCSTASLNWLSATIAWLSASSRRAIAAPSRVRCVRITAASVATRRWYSSVRRLAISLRTRTPNRARGTSTTTPNPTRIRVRKPEATALPFSGPGVEMHRVAQALPLDVGEPLGMSRCEQHVGAVPVQRDVDVPGSRPGVLEHRGVVGDHEVRALVERVARAS